jgi:hypothetical protein
MDGATIRTRVRPIDETQRPFAVMNWFLGRINAPPSLAQTRDVWGGLLGCGHFHVSRARSDLYRTNRYSRYDSSSAPGFAESQFVTSLTAPDSAARISSTQFASRRPGPTRWKPRNWLSTWMEPLQRNSLSRQPGPAAILCADVRVERWSVRTLPDRVRSMFFERTAISRQSDTLIRQELE